MTAITSEAGGEPPVRGSCGASPVVIDVVPGGADAWTPWTSIARVVSVVTESDT